MVATANRPLDRKTEFATTGEVCDELRISKSTLARWVRDGGFPRPIRIGPRAIRFRVSAVREWLNAVYAAATVDVEKRLAEPDAVTESKEHPAEQTAQTK